MPTTLIDDVPELREFSVALKSLGYRNTDQLVAAYQVAGDLLATYLKVDGGRLRGLVDSIPQRPRSRGIELRPPRVFSLGVRLASIPRSRRALTMSPVSAVPLPPQMNMIPQMPPVRDQGARGTCVAHACVAVLEQYLGLQNKYQDMSEQFLYWNCKQADGEPNDEGTWIGVAVPLLQRDGCCLESTWGYNPTPVAGNEGQGPPPANAAAEAMGFRVMTTHQLTATSIIDIKAELAGKRCVAFSIPVYDSWYRNDEVQRTGEIVNPIPNEPEVGGHAMCFVGYEDIPDQPDLGGGKFYLRNSWNGDWATEPVLGTKGYGTIPYSYIARFATEAYSIQ